MVFTDTDYKLFTIGAKFKSKGFRALSEIIDMVEEKLNKKQCVFLEKQDIFFKWKRLNSNV